MNRIGSRIALVAGSLALMVGGLFAIGSPRTAEVMPATATGPTAPYVAFESTPGGGARVAFYETASSTPTRSVAVELNDKCVVTNTAALGELLGLSIVEGSRTTGVQLISNGLGSPGSGKCSRSGGRVLQGQELVLSVGSWLAGQGYGFTSASLNIEAKFGAQLEYAFGGASFTSEGLAASGDNGPDSGDGDNNTVPLIGPGFELKLRPAPGTGEIALENGGDGTLGGSYLELARLLDCGDSVTRPGDVTSGSIGSATFDRLDNKLPGPCTPITLDIDFEPDTTINGTQYDVISIVPGDDPLGVRARATLVWNVDRFDGNGNPRPQGDIDAELQREIQYVDETPSLLTYCEGFDGLTDEPVNPDDQAWCVLSDTRVLVGDQVVQTIELNVNGDPRMF